MDEQQAIALLKQCDLAGLEYLVQQYQGKAVHTAYLITGDLAAAEDVVQTVFLRLAHKIDLFDDGRAVIVQRHFLKMSEAEMVERLHRPPSTVKWWLHTARERLKSLLGGYHNGSVGENHEKR